MLLSRALSRSALSAPGTAPALIFNLCKRLLNLSKALVPQPACPGSPPVSCICILENCALTRQARFPILIPSLSLSCSLWGSMQGQVQPISECGSNRRCVATSAARSTQLPQRRNTSFILITIRLPKEEEQQQCQTTLSCIPISYIAIYNPKGQPLVCCALIEIATDAAVGDSPRISHFALVSQVSVDRAEVDN